MVMADSIKHYTEQHLRGLLKQKLTGTLQASLAQEIGVSPAFLSKALSGEPLTGKIVSWLGFKRVKIRVFEKL
jgi:hypothetical protein